MDVDAALTMALEIAHDIVNEKPTTAEDAVQLASDVIAIHEWIATGGFLPGAWRSVRHPFRPYSGLSDAEQEQARERALTDLLMAVVEGAIRFNDPANGDDLQARIDRALAESERLHTPWFAGEIVMEDSVVAEAMTGMAQYDAEDAWYPTPGTRVIQLDTSVERVS
jgi:hypothetical protein